MSEDLRCKVCNAPLVIALTFGGSGLGKYALQTLYCPKCTKRYMGVIDNDKPRNN